MLNASQKRMNRAALTHALMSSTPASTAGWLATMPTLCPPRWANPQMMLAAKSRCTSKNSPSSTTRRSTSCMSYGLFALSGTMSSSASSRRSRGSRAGPARRRLHVVRRHEPEQRRGWPARHSSSRVEREVRHALTSRRACRRRRAAPSSRPRASPSSRRSGPVTNMNDVPRTMNVKSVIAGEYTAPPAQGPRIAEICGTTPDASVLRRKMSA